MAREFDWQKVQFSKEAKTDAYERGLDSMKLADRSVVIGEHGRGREAVGFTLWTTTGEAQAGMEAVKTLQSLFSNIKTSHPDVVKYSPQIDPIVKDADDWDKSWFGKDETALGIGRRAQTLAMQIARDYGYPFTPDARLDTGGFEQVLDSEKGVAKNVGGAVQGVATFTQYLPWIIVGGTALLGFAMYKILQGDTGKTLASSVGKIRAV